MLRFLTAILFTITGTAVAQAYPTETLARSGSIFWEIDFLTDPEGGKVYIIVSSTQGEDGICHIALREDGRDDTASYGAVLAKNESSSTISAIIFEPNSEEPRPLEWFYSTEYDCPEYEGRNLVPNTSHQVMIVTESEAVTIFASWEIDTAEHERLMDETMRRFVLAKLFAVDDSGALSESTLSLYRANSFAQNGHEFLETYIFRNDTVSYGMVLTFP